MTNKLTDYRSINLLISNMSYRTWKIITNIFLNIFLWKVTNDIQVIALYNIAVLIMHIISYTISSYYIKNWFRSLFSIISLIWYIWIYFILIYFWETITNYYIFIGIFVWLFNGMYWSVYNINEFDFTNPKNRWNFQWLKKSIKNIISIVIPALVWILIWINYSNNGYNFAYSLGIIFFIISAIYSINRIDYNSWKYELSKTLKIIWRNKNLLKFLLNTFLIGFSLSWVLISTILPLILFTQWINEIKLGFLISIFNILSILLSYLFWKFIHYKSYKNIYIISCVFYITLVAILLIFPLPWYVVLFSTLINLLYTFIWIPQSVYGSNILHEIKEYSSIKSEFINIREVCSILWLLMSYICIYTIWDFTIYWIILLFSIMSLFMLISLFLFKSITIKTDY